MDPNEQMVPRMFSIPQLRTHISQKARDTPNFLYAALDTATCAPFVKERRMKFAESTKLHRKSGVWGTLYSLVLKGGWRGHPDRVVKSLYGLESGAVAGTMKSSARIR
jgi:hypothetical protein